MRFLSTSGALVGLLVLQAPARAQETIRYLDRKTGKEASTIGTITEETPAAVACKPGAGSGTKEISALDIYDVEYDVPGKVKLLYKGAEGDEKKAASPATRDAERKTALGDALAKYQEVLSQLPKERFRFAERHMQYKIARVQALIAEESPEEANAAVDSLTNFVKKYADGWQIGHAARLLARLQMAAADTEGARRTYETLATTANIPKQVREDCDFLIVDALLNGKKFAEAQKKLQSVMQGLSTDDPRATRAKIYLAECLGVSGKLPEGVKQLEAIIAQTSDKKLLGQAYNALGDCYRLSGRGKDALWPYLWVDVIYHQDKEEHIKAMEQLAKLFDEQGDKTRARQYRERLKRESR
jgi:tetratricopeptide (TPR) repeat protein